MDDLRLSMVRNGIAPSDQGRIFRLFKRGHAGVEYASTGIGLAFARKGVERMGGRVGLESPPRTSSRFWVELPAAKNPPLNIEGGILQS